MSESTVLRSSASPKNASPHMAGGKNHVQVAPKPMVNVTMANGGPIQQTQKDKNVVIGKPQRAIAVRASAPQRQPAPQIGEPDGGGAGGGGTPQMGVGVGSAKPMISVTMDGRTPKIDNGKNTGNRGNVVLLNRGGGASNRQISKRASGGGAFAQRSAARAALAAGSNVGVQTNAIAAGSVSGLTADQLMCCRHAVDQYIKDQGEAVNAIVADLAKSTLAAIDRELTARTAEPEFDSDIEVSAPAPMRQVSVGGARAGVAAPRRFAPAAAPVRRVVPAPAPAPIAVEVPEGNDEPNDDPSFDGSNMVDGDVIDIQPTE